MSVTIELTHRWPMGHRILGLEGPGAKCANPHGHNWEAHVELANDDGLLEFGAVRGAVDEWIKRHWDHGFLFAKDDPLLAVWTEHGFRHATVPTPPTTEAIAERLAYVVQALTGRLPSRVRVVEGYRNAAVWRA